MRRDAPAAHRNRAPLLAILREVLPAEGLVLEVGSGSGQHAVWFAPELPGIVWQPSDLDPASLASIEAWRAELPSPNVRAPILLDLHGEAPVDRADAIVATNVLHASPWSATLGLLDLAARILPPGAPVVLYGAWREAGWAEPSNVAFDLELKQRDPSFGIRDLEAVVAEAEARGLRWERTIPVPANNRVVVLRR